MIKIGDKFETESYGSVVVIDIFISPTTQERVYKVRTTTDGIVVYYFVDGGELTQ